jgi:hypothetical protein
MILREKRRPKRNLRLRNWWMMRSLQNMKIMIRQRRSRMMNTMRNTVKNTMKNRLLENVKSIESKLKSKLQLAQWLPVSNKRTMEGMDSPN